MRILVLNLVLVLRTTPPFGHPSNGGELETIGLRNRDEDRLYVIHAEYHTSYNPSGVMYPNSGEQPHPE